MTSRDKSNLPDIEAMRKRLKYVPETGEIVRMRGPYLGRHVGTVRGTPGREYMSVGVFGSVFQFTHIAWALHTGEWPNEQIDHINNMRMDNRWRNLREASAKENARNKKRTRNNTTGFKGVSFDKQTQKYRASIRAGLDRRDLGRYATAEAAHAAYAKAAYEMHGPFANLG